MNLGMTGGLNINTARFRKAQQALPESRRTSFLPFTEGLRLLAYHCRSGSWLTLWEGESPVNMAQLKRALIDGNKSDFGTKTRITRL